MKHTRFLVLITLAFASVMATSSSPDPMIFVSASPCDPVARHYLDIPKDFDCEMIKWRLSLYKDPRNQSPTRFELSYTYGMTKPGTEGFMNGGFAKELKGKWTATKSTSQRAGSHVYQLIPDSRPGTISFLKLDENVLHLLDLKGNFMIGNAGFSYTMNKL
ncbi:copper resistance protein NlpE [Dyadobacter sp. CY323]|uniref:copper resistance protein NlpE n=1 Tax=Dyadobacter sp. CY323 TaxID=2907302 RepID=UPI001F19260D|nr:copper resistance protein NlpE [Dyadobacter sp. CY323]MCE6991875.1 copper resistance protein NlpE [Dyadobacter sp. CY323]